MLGRVEREGFNVIWISRVTNEASGSVRVDTNEEKECKMMRVPESFEALVADLLVGSSVDQNHDEQHEMASNTTGLVIVYVLGGFRADLYFYSKISNDTLWGNAETYECAQR